jgi:hypothetical protein
MFRKIKTYSYLVTGRQENITTQRQAINVAMWRSFEDSGRTVTNPK